MSVKDYVVKSYQMTRIEEERQPWKQRVTKTRYRVFDLEGNLVDDAQGYGYKSARNAHIGYSYKRQPEHQKTDKKLKRLVRSWCHKHADVAASIEVYVFDTLKSGQTLTALEEKALFEGLTAKMSDVPFTAADYFKYR